MSSSTEIFRHLRPHWYDRNKHELIPSKTGGVSFLLTPIDAGLYHFWVYSCPADIPFSSKQAVHTLRQVKAAGTVPWGTIMLTEEPVLDTLVRSLIYEESVLPTEIGQHALSIDLINTGQRWRYDAMQRAMAGAKEHYEDD